jgi:hypothetical protein
MERSYSLQKIALYPRLPQQSQKSSLWHGPRVARISERRAWTSNMSRRRVARKSSLAWTSVLGFGAANATEANSARNMVEKCMLALIEESSDFWGY